MQPAMAEKSNEITAIPELLSTLALNGCTVTIYAMGTQTAIAQAIHMRGADYVLAVKDNQPKLAESIQDFWQTFRAHPATHTPHTVAESVEKDHGRIETRRSTVFDQLECLDKPQQWKGLRCFIVRESERTIGDKTSHEQRLYSSSLAPDAGASARSSALTGPLRTDCTGSWMSLSTTTKCAPAPRPPRTTSPYSNTSPSISSDSIRSNEKEASRHEESSPPPPIATGKNSSRPNDVHAIALTFLLTEIFRRVLKYRGPSTRYL